jgi:hypothetical protein
MNRAARRRLARERQQLAAERNRIPGAVRQVLNTLAARADCHATADITFVDTEAAVVDIWHDNGCPAADGTVKWRPASMD